MAINKPVTILASAARTASPTVDDIRNESYRGVHIVINATAKANTPSVVATIQGKDPVSGAYYDLLASAAITDVSVTILRLHPHAAEVANVATAEFLPATWRLHIVHGDADSLTYSVGATLLS